MSKPVRIRDIAQACGVSVGAVSRALKGQPGLREETRQRIIAIAEQQGYDFTRLRSEKIKRILFLLHRQHNISRALPFYSPLLLGIEDCCRDKGIALSFLAIGPGDAINDQVMLHQPDALICAGFFEPELLALLQQLKLPLVLADSWAPGLPCVNPDNALGGYLATHHLITQGRRRIAFLASTLSHYSIRQRENGYRKALYEAQMLMPPDYEAIAPPLVDTELALEQAVNELLSLPEPPDAIFAYNDAAALVVVRLCAERGLRIPEDIALVGFDNIDSAQYATPALTTIGVNKQQLGREAVRLLLDGRAEDNHLLAVKLIQRNST
ncbi:LacI family transcriptional regulator [Superficieibacter electus]|uniref:LacI family transcriptional regulator n=1 Tax=Superficieibacter electus TaxID=2022662 RepID=A0A2P5GL32_9ENTR|nr:LacI family DNA-binding transcriptional regulator [Superficieibacter electus]POP42622.1 LacI family transcriptional regulator [Superficieibacter electus]POP45698.1 LacI family transcriptional regulator [Superficieibacter electus]